MMGLANFAIGFALAVHFGHGPPWIDLVQQIRQIRSKAEPRATTKSALPAKTKAH
jgi:hypothetical protein